MTGTTYDILSFLKECGEVVCKMRGFRNWFLVSILTVLLVFMGGCSLDSEDDESEDEDNPINGCGFEGDGNDGAVALSTAQPVTLDESSEETQNTPGDGTGYAGFGWKL
jgi:hypothetical protein